MSMLDAPALATPRGSAPRGLSRARTAVRLDDRARLERFLRLGCGTTYRAGELELGSEHADLVTRCLAADAPDTLGRIVAASTTGRVPKNDPALFSLAIAARRGDDVTRRAAYRLVPQLCTSGERLMRFVELARRFGGWGRGLRNAVAAWFAARPANELAQEMATATGHHGWSYRDLIRLAHPRAVSPAHDRLFAWAVQGELPAASSDPALAPIAAQVALQRTGDAAEAARLIRGHRVPRGCVPSHLLVHAEVWDALADELSLDELLRDLPAMTRAGLVAPGASATARIARRLGDRQSCSHPIALLAALVTYRAGRARGQAAWLPVATVVDALEAGFEHARATLEPLGKRVLIALDVSRSMASGSVAGVSGLTPRLAASGMAVLATMEREHRIVAFGAASAGHGGRWGGGAPSLVELSSSFAGARRLDEIAAATDGVAMGGIDCAVPMIWAREHRVDVDVFVVYTDDETWAGDVPPARALHHYRDARGLPAKLIVVGMTSSGFALADPDDAGMLDVVGFDVSTPPVLADFARA
jgi:60 kDa SS-A/Ro ribonucleoprotein